MDALTGQGRAWLLKAKLLWLLELSAAELRRQREAGTNSRAYTAPGGNLEMRGGGGGGGCTAMEGRSPLATCSRIH